MIPSADRPALLLVSRLNFGYPEHPLFHELSAALPAGVTLVRGGDGRGKTTLLRLLGGQLPVKDGVLQLDGIRLDEDGEAYRRQVFYIDPRTEIHDRMTPPEFFAAMRERFPGFDDTRLPALTEGLSLTPHLQKQLFMLSTGSKRKVYLAAAFAANATLTLLDDPFAGLDRASIDFVMQTLNAQAGHGRQAWVLAMYEAPAGVALASTIDLGD
jgi:ABC-type multidrug transport system ATPase subunit